MRCYRGSMATIVCAAFGLAAAPPPAAADLPADQCVVYLMRADPGDPNSPRAFAVTLTLTASSASGDSIGWSVTGAEFVEFGQYNVAIRAWIDDQPDVGSVDGLWWIMHANPGSPQVSEFALPPPLSGSATAQDPGNANLDYALSGAPYDPSPQDPLYPATAALDYAFVLAGGSEPLRVGESEPVEIDNERDPPTSGQLVACGAADQFGGAHAVKNGPMVVGPGGSARASHRRARVGVLG